MGEGEAQGEGCGDAYLRGDGVVDADRRLDRRHRNLLHRRRETLRQAPIQRGWCAWM